MCSFHSFRSGSDKMEQKLVIEEIVENNETKKDVVKE